MRARASEPVRVQTKNEEQGADGPRWSLGGRKDEEEHPPSSYPPTPGCFIQLDQIGRAMLTLTCGMIRGIALSI